MTAEQLATIIELALYRVGDKWRRSDNADVVLVGMAVREVGEEVANLMRDHNRALAG